MKLIIYRASNGASYPGVILRFLLSVMIAFLTLELAKRDSAILASKNDYWQTLAYFIVGAFCINEWIFFVHLWGINKICPVDKMKWYILFQIGLGVILPTLVLTLVYSAKNCTFLKNDPTTLTPVLPILNIIYYSCYFSYFNKYTPCFYKVNGTGIGYVLTSDVVVIAKENEDSLIIDKYGKLYVGTTVLDLESIYKNLNPKDFKLYEQGYISNRRFLKNATTDELSLMFQNSIKSYLELK